MALVEPLAHPPWATKLHAHSQQHGSFFHGCEGMGWAQQASTAATDQYCTTFDSSTTDSAVSDQENLACHEDLGCPEEPCATDRLPSCAKAQQKSPVQICTFTTPAQPEARETIRNELARERETQSQLYFKRHAHLTKDLRSVAVSWAIQVAEQFRVEQETLFLAVSYLDRFLSVTEDVVHMDGLQLSTLACLSLAAKQAEVTQPSTAEWVWLVHTQPWGTKEQLSRMEWIIMENLEWRGSTPTAWWFLHQLCYGLGTCPAPVICMAAFLLELALIEAGPLFFKHSSLAAAALMLSHTMQGSVSEDGTALPSSPLLSIRTLLELAPEVDVPQVQDACAWLGELYAHASVLPWPDAEQALEGLQLVRSKYATEMWHYVGCANVPLIAKAALADP